VSQLNTKRSTVLTLTICLHNCVCVYVCACLQFFCRRLERLTRPTKVLGEGAPKGKFSGLNTSDTAEDSDVAEGQEGSESVEVGVGRSKPAAPATKAGPSTGKPASIANPQEAITPTAAPVPAPLLQHKELVELKRSVSPSTSLHKVNDNKEDHLRSIGSAPPHVSRQLSEGSAVSASREGAADGAGAGSGSSTPYLPGTPSARAELNVRGSLTLLKTKTRRRRTAAEIEGSQQSAAPSELDARAMQSNLSEQQQQEEEGRQHDSTQRERDVPTLRTRQAPAVPAVPAAPSVPAAVRVGGATRDNRGQASGDKWGEEGGRSEGEVEGEGEEEGVVQQNLQPCPECGRRFNPTAFQKHAKLCAQVFMRKRKAFDSAQMRLEGNEDLKSFVESERKVSGTAAKRGKAKSTSNGAAPAPQEAATSKWKEKSEAFRNAMKAARDVSHAIATGAPLPPPVPSAPDSSLIPCPHCQRRFNANAAERHIPNCQKIINKPTVLKRGGGGNASKGGGNAASASNSSKSRSWQ
jgi:hypothetical protein